MKIEWNERPYSNVITNEVMAKLYQTNAENLGLTFESREEQEKMAVGSTDMGNVSHIKPSIHPFYDIDTTEANHTVPFTAASGTMAAHDMSIFQCKILAMLALDVMCDDNIMREIQADFDRAHNSS